MADTTNYSQSQDILNAVKVLEGLEEAGTISAAEQAALNKFRAKSGGAKREVAKTQSAYRGMQQGVTLGFADEIGGGVAALTGGDYATKRDDIRKKDMAAMLVAPDEFSKGKLAGGIATVALPSAGIMKYTAGMGPLAKSVYGGLTGGLLGGLAGFGEGEGGFVNRMKSASLPAGVGAGVGLLAPVLGYAGGKIARGVQDRFRSVPGFGARATQTMAGALNRSQAAGTDIRAYLDTLGPEGMLADIPGNPRRVAQGLAAMPGEGGEMLGNAIEQRAAGASGRIKTTADDAIAVPNAAFDERRALATERTSVLGPEYDIALDAPPIDASGVGASINAIRKDAVGNVASSIKNIETALGGKVDEKGNLVFGEVSAIKLHNIRSELSDDIAEAKRAGRAKFVAQMTPVLEKIDAELDSLPGYIDARTGYANNKAMERALDDGRAVFRGGEASAKSPDELRKEIQKLSPAQLDAYRKGAREYIAALMGTSKNDAAAAWGAFAKEWNEEKLRIILGKPEADKVINRLKAENIFSQTRGDVLKGSQTQMRSEAANALGDFRLPDSGQRPGPLRRLANTVNDAGNSAVDSILYSGRGQSNLDLGKLLSMQGAERDGLLPLLLGEAARKNMDTKTQKVVTGLLDLALRSSAPALSPLVTNNP